jgi:hypothetical protein
VLKTLCATFDQIIVRIAISKVSLLLYYFLSQIFFIFFYRRQKKKKRQKKNQKEWKKLWEELHRIGHATQNWEKEIERKIFVVSIVRSFLLFLILTFWKGQQKNWCFLVLHRMTIFLTMNIFSENYDAFTEMGRFNEMFLNWRLKLNNKQFKSLSNTANLLASLNY